MSAYGYRGRHRKPTNTGKAVARAAVAGAVAAGPSLTMVGTANAAPDWSAIIACESAGNPQAQNGSSTASGLFQFINGTWKAYGGSTTRARDASTAEQYAVANRAYAAEGFGPWAASKSCWQGRTGSASPAAGQVAKPRAEQAQARPRVAAGSGGYVVKAGDTLTGIAAARDTTWREIAARNTDAVRNPDLIFPGQRLVV